MDTAKLTAAATEAPSEKPVPILAYKGFDAQLRCREFQYEVGKTYKHDGPVEACASGFHSCENPLDVWGYYGPAGNRFAEVEASGEIARDGGDSKIASAEITIKAELTLPEFIQRGVKWVLDHVDWANAKELNTGDRSAATNTGNRSAATNTGDRSAATNTGYRSVATNTGYQSAATNTGYQSVATVSGKHSVAISTGCEGVAMADVTGAICLVCRDWETGEILAIRASKVGENGIEPNVAYRLTAGGEFVRAE